MISVCMATYNGDKYLKKQLESILCQIGPNDEIIISDDGSKDQTLSIIDSFNDTRIKVFHHENDHSFTNNFENALRYAQGDYIFLSDQDDIWMSNKVPKVLQALRDYDIVVHDAELIDGKGVSMNKTYFSTMHNHTSFIANLWKTRWLGCCMAFKHDVLMYCMPFPKGIVAHDYWIGMMGMTSFKYCFMNDVLLQYRRHGGNVSPSGEKSNNTLWYMIFTKRLPLLLAIFKRKLNRSLNKRVNVILCTFFFSIAFHVPHK